MGTPEDIYDVCIIGGGLAGNMQARHLRMYVPEVSVAIVESRSDDQIARSRKVGESTVEIAGIFMARDLDLFDYLVETQRPKYGLNFHFRDRQGRNEKLTDYTSYMSHIIPPLPAWQIDRRSMERDLLAMNENDGVAVFRPCRACGVSRQAGGYQLELRSLEDRSRKTIRAKWLIDASGRKQFLNHKLVEDNMVDEPRPNTASFWIRVDRPDRRCFNETVRDARTMTSPYYATNHFFGRGHWIWTIPLPSGELSVGIVCDKDIVQIREVFKKEKFLAFLEREHKLLYNLCTSGEIVDCLALHHLPYSSKKYYSSQRWALLGDAACFTDPFYSQGLVFTAVQICQLSELVKLDLVEQVPREEFDQAVTNYDIDFANRFTVTRRLFERMYEFCDDPRAMQEKLLWDQVVWFKMLIPWFVTRFFLQMRHRPTEKVKATGSFAAIRDQMDELCIALKESRHVPRFLDRLYTHEVIDSDVHRCIFEFECSNPFKGVVYCYRYSIRMRLRLLFGIHGIGALGKLTQWKWIVTHLIEMGVMGVLSLRRQWRLWRERRPQNSLLQEQGARFANYAGRTAAKSEAGKQNVALRARV